MESFDEITFKLCVWKVDYFITENWAYLGWKVNLIMFETTSKNH